MRLLLFLLAVILPILSNAQLHFGLSEKEIRDIYPDKTFEAYYFEGEKIIKTFMDYGTFYYSFDKETGLCNDYFQIVDEMDLGYLNSQVEAYNKKYAIISDTEWKADLEGGGVLSIYLGYDNEDKEYYFSYDNALSFEAESTAPDANREISVRK